MKNVATNSRQPQYRTRSCSDHRAKDVDLLVYWDYREDEDGMLDHAGLAYHNRDVKASTAMIKQFVHHKQNVLELMGGNGRVSKHVLTKLFTNVDMVDMSHKLVALACKTMSDCGRPFRTVWRQPV